MKYLTIIVAIIALFVNGTNAQIIQIPSDYPTIQAGIDTASDGDTVLVTEGTYFENINFLGKAITVASEFLMDGDSSHISRTIIDGSQPQNPDYGSVVSMWTGEDTTSILMGFTVTGGSGTYVDNIHADFTASYFGGGGILIYNSGGKIVHNIIERNYITDPDNRVRGAIGCGILAAVNHNHTAIIRNNIVRYNTGTDGVCDGGGIGLHGGRCIVENNIVRDNTLDAVGLSGGPGILFEHEFQPGTIEETIIRNNRIYRNIAFSDNGVGFGGGIAISRVYDNVLIYNNLILGNQAHFGGGIYSWNTSSCKVFNNTIVNNESQTSGSNVCLDEGCHMTLFNNIIWSDSINEVDEIGYWDTGNSSLRLYHNILSKPCNPPYPVTREGNSYLDPELDGDTYEPGPNSPAVGRGIDSMWIGSTWYLAPALDINGNPRPADPDQMIDIGAFESEFTRPILSNADLASIGIWGHSLDPPFHRDTLEYLLVKDSGITMIGKWEIYAADDLATLEIDTAADLLSENELDRTTKILVTAMDGTTQKEYIVVYKYLSSDATLSSLDISLGAMDPSFDPSITTYFDTIPYGTRITPEVVCSTSDTDATVLIKDAENVNVSYELYRTTFIYVTAPNDITIQEYTIIFTVDNTRPSLTLLNDSVEVGKGIGMIVSEPGTVYLVPENTPAIYDSILNVKLAWVEAGTDTLFLSIDNPETTGTFWLYARGKYQSLSESQPITIYASTAVSEFNIKGFKIYPIPATNALYFDTPYPIVHVELYNVIGVPVLEAVNPDRSISIGHLPEGIYILQVEFENEEVITTRMIKY